MLLFKFLMILMIPFTMNLSKNESNNEVSEYQIEFEQKVKENYQYYESYKNYKNDKFEIIVYKGVFNGEASYAVKYVKYNDTMYNCVIDTDGHYYDMPNNEAIAIKADKNIRIQLYSKYNTIIPINNSLLPKFEINNYYLENSRLLSGNNKGVDFTPLSLHVFKFSYIAVLCCVLILCFFASSIITIVLILVRKSRDNVRVKTLLMSNLYYDEDTNHIVDKISINKEIINNVTISEDIKISEIEDITQFLKDNGYNVNYSMLEEEDKNKITVKLMELKDEKKISEEKYLEEIYKLWKK